MSREDSGSQTAFVTAAASEIRPRFGKAAGGFIFLPFVLTVCGYACVRACVCVHVCVCVCVWMCSVSPLSRIKEKRGGGGAPPLHPLFDWIFTGKGERRLVLEARYSVRTCTIIPEYLPVATSNQQRHTQITISEEDVFPPEVLADDYSTIRYRQQRFMLLLFVTCPWPNAFPISV